MNFVEIMSKVVLSFSLLILFSELLAAQSSFPLVTKFVKAPFPPVARAVRAQGDVQIMVKINSEGSLINATAIQGHKLLSKAAEVSAAAWTFTAVPGNHYVTLVFQFRERHKGKWKPARLTGHYNRGYIEPRYEIVQTVSPYTGSSSG